MTGEQIILIVDDDSATRISLEQALTRAGHAVATACDGEEALLKLEGMDADAVISDINMPGMTGHELLWECTRRWPGMPVILMTGSGSVPDAVNAIKSGAADYILKPLDIQELLNKIAVILVQSETISWTTTGSSLLTEELWGGKSPAMQRLYKLLERVAPTEATTLLLGESGTGKEKIAGLLHKLSHRARGPFVVVDCGSTPSTLLESELFGHIKGSFTNAVKDKKGLIAEAHGGTLFLDEIGNISHEMQLRLLRFLQEKKVRRIGDVQEKAVDCRVVAATNADLPALVREGRFREDLYYRLKVITIQVPPLRHRKEDLSILTEGFLRLFAGSRPLPSLDENVAKAMLEYSWPGNVRELRNILEAACILCTSGTIRLEDMQFEASDPLPPLHDSDLSLEDSERQVLVSALLKANWVIKDAAELLGISRRTMHYKIKKFRINTTRREP